MSRPVASSMPRMVAALLLLAGWPLPLPLPLPPPPPLPAPLPLPAPPALG
jgi:hypothetical protein